MSELAGGQALNPFLRKDSLRFQLSHMCLARSAGDSSAGVRIENCGSCKNNVGFIPATCPWRSTCVARTGVERTCGLISPHVRSTPVRATQVERHGQVAGIKPTLFLQLPQFSILTPALESPAERARHM